MSSSEAEQETLVVRAFGAALYGIEAIPVEVEAAKPKGLPQSSVLGRASSEVREARDRLKIALRAQGLWRGEGEPSVIVNLAPAGIPKSGTALDLPICLAVVATRQADLAAGLGAVLGYAEVSLDGSLRPIAGTLSAAMAARERGLRAILVPPESAREAAQVGGLEVLAVRDLRSAIAVLRGQRDALCDWPPPPPAPGRPDVDLADVKGQLPARRALEVAAAGGHNLLMIGPPGSGKTLLARRLPTILPPPTQEEALEATRIHSAAGLVTPGAGLLSVRPFRAPHHTVSAAGLVGGGVPPRPGEISLATHGVLFLDELPEFARGVIEMLRQPMEDRKVVIVRAAGRATFPARFMLAAAMNPCPCGWHGADVRECACPPGARERYRRRLSGPLLDRVDLHVPVAAVDPEALRSKRLGEDSATVRARVVAARAVQAERNHRHGATVNAELPVRALEHLCTPARRARRALDDALEDMALSARAHDRILKVARTLADLAGRDTIDVPDIAEAVAYRQLDRAPTCDH
jgi:magnesium chelatase family protein